VFTSDRLGKLATYYHHEAGKCCKGRAYFAACVMQAAAFEAALQAMCFLYPEQVKKTTVYQKKRFKTKRNKALEFNLYELINIAYFPHITTAFSPNIQLPERVLA
jgi:hypothetical protein